MRAFKKGFPESGALGHEGVAESYAAGDEQPARAKCGQRPVPAGPGVETGIPAQRPGFAPERFGGDFVSLPAFSGEKQMEQAKPYSMSFTSVREAHGFAQAGGVMGAVKAYLKEEADKINAVQVANLDKKAIGSLRAYAKTGKAPGQFIEVMACEGGCITGPCAHNEIAAGKRQLTQELAKREETY